MIISKMNISHWDEVKRIYQQGIDTGQATFENSPPVSWKIWCDKFLSNLSLVCLADDMVIGWAAISPVSPRKIYQGVGEVSIYIANDYQGQGVGRELMKRIVTLSEDAGFWTLQAGIFPENISSIHLHEETGFRIVGERKKIGQMAFGQQKGKWRNVVLMERRSEKIGH